MSEKVGKISVVIRVRNERDNLKRLLNKLDKQTVKPQIIVVDNESTDGTRELALARGALVVDIPRDEFSYPRASNAGVSAADGELVVFLSAHSFPRHSDMLERGARHFSNPEVAGVYGPSIPNKTIMDRLIAPLLNLDVTLARGGVLFDRKARRGQLQSTNSMIRSDLLARHPFDESYGAGAEDMEWANWALAQGFATVKDRRFSVNHSHGLGFKGWIKQFREWERIRTPKPFDRRAIVYRRRRHE